MSLLMQALKKAERAKQNSLQEEELEKPSEAYDQVLELAPADDTPIPSARQAQPPPSFETTDTLSLEPMASNTPSQPEPPTEPRTEKRAETPPPPPPKPKTNQASRATPPPRSAVSIDPATVRLAVLLGILLLVVGVMGYWYWRASSSPGAGANLPGVPMPLTDAPGASNAGPAAPIVVVAPSASEQEPAPVIHHEERTVVHAEPAPPPAPVPPRVVPPDTSNIKVLRTDTAPRINPGLQQAYQSLNDGQLTSARQQYEAVLRQETSNRDALLGLASVALREQQGAQAAALYVRLLELNPDDGVALAGLISLRQGDVVQSESKLKAILARSPDSGPVLFALGNVYAKQRRWPEAQQQFFRAYSAAPGNPDYAFNLAVGLDQLNQPKMAASYYARALALAQTAPAAFNQAAAQARLRELGAPVNPATDGIVITRQE
ncbi:MULTISPECIES: lipopolysaccharide assembly protein LapB [unclassified Janthinobacterium]|uniref:tetratricopeptide repeat protein n=1 Tax=unclassified Janthinobacterium TaxID=2610881 RepID=UPI0016074920|nr:MULTISPECIES: tetratricopeptide repeat protein [unclassified Janthinobacterium]MBB5368650.1 Tfp pilus assembly protein PilF [Janthinobacterium sp. K2C7]MBB5381814.1 Tfp pilus assembly protein PilF [Janthinobacterium sp. K2Li3]MBB5387032.1 Tfp pilus assembly protein PilF [Janthinobacterium sp. K2E3]